MDSGLECSLFNSMREGNISARAELILAYRPLVIRIARDLTRTRPDLFEDAKGDGFLGLITAVDRFQPAKGTAFFWFAHRGITWAIKSGYRATGSLIRRPMNTRKERYRAPPVRFQRYADHLAAPPDRIDPDDWAELTARLACLTAGERDLITAYYGDRESLKEIGKRLDVSYQTVLNRITRAMGKMNVPRPRLRR